MFLTLGRGIYSLMLNKKSILEKRLFSIKESSKYLGCGALTLRELIYAKRLPVVRFGKKQYLDIYDLDRFINENKS